MKKSFIFTLIALICTFCCIGGVAACANKNRGPSLKYAKTDGGYAFIGISSKDYEGKVVVPSTFNGKPVVRIEEGAFSSCGNVTSIELPDSIVSIGKDAFSGCGSLTSIKIPEGVTVIESGTFRDCTSLTEIELPSSITTVRPDAFSGCNNITKATLPAEATKDCVASSKSTLKTVVINGGEVIPEQAFSDFTNLTSVTIPDTVTTIGSSAFYGCEGLTSIEIPSSVKTIGIFAFSDCTSLTSLVIPSSVTNIQALAFNRCSGLTSIEVEDGNPIYFSEGNCIIEIAPKQVVLCCKTSVIPADDRVIRLDTSVFEGCVDLTRIFIPHNVKHIGMWVFAYCSELKTIEYDGTIDEWKHVTKGDSWNYSTGEYEVICNDGKLTKLESELTIRDDEL